MLPTLVSLGILLALIFYFIGSFNKLVRMRNFVQEGWSTIDVLLKKRHDLIPNLVETVKGYATHEKGTLEAVIQARSRALGANNVKESEAAEKQLSTALMNLLVISEQYPELQANVNFRQLQSELSELESGIEKSRRYYNGTARDFNIVVESFPSNIVANVFNFDKASYFELENKEERHVPEVKF